MPSLTRTSSDMVLDPTTGSKVSDQIGSLLGSVVPLEKYRLGSVDDTAVLNNAIADVSDGYTIQFQQGKTYVLSSIPTITKCITLDFNGAIIQVNTTGILFTLGFATGNDRKPPIRLINGWFASYNSVQPTDVIKIDGAINPVIDNCEFNGITATHSIIWNNASYGLRGKIIIHYCNAPQAIRFSQTSNSSSYSYDVHIDTDISNHTGTGIYIEGGDFQLDGVVESCSNGGINCGVEWNVNKLIIKTYFEANSVYDIQLNNGASYSIDGVQISSKFIGNNTLNKILLGTRVHVVTMGCYFEYGGVDGVTSNPGASTYLGINNRIYASGTGYTNNYEISDQIKGQLYHNIVQPFQLPVTPTIALNAGSTATGTVTLSSASILYKGLTEVTYLLKYTFTPTAIGQGVFTIGNIQAGYAIKTAEIHLGTESYDGKYCTTTRRDNYIYGTISATTYTHDLWVTLTLAKTFVA